MEINWLLLLEIPEEHIVTIVDILICFRPKITFLLVKATTPFIKGRMNLQTVSIMKTGKKELTCSGGNETDHRNWDLAFGASRTFCDAGGE